MLPPYPFDSGIEHDCTVKAHHSPFWLDDPETLMRIRNAVVQLLGMCFWSVNDQGTFTESVQWLARLHCEDFELDPCLIPVIQLWATTIAAGTTTGSITEPLDLLTDTVAGLATFEACSVASQSQFLSTYEAQPHPHMEELD